MHAFVVRRAVGVNLTLDDFQRVSDRVPFIADLKPSGRYVMEDVHKVGGTPAVLKYLAAKGFINTDCMTVTCEPLPACRRLLCCCHFRGGGEGGRVAKGRLRASRRVNEVGEAARTLHAGGLRQPCVVRAWPEPSFAPRALAACCRQDHGREPEPGA